VSALSIEPLDEVHRQDLVYVAWRTMVLTSLGVLTVLALSFWGGTGERSYGYFAGMLVFAMGYLAAIDGDLRWLPGTEALLGSSAQANRIIGCGGILFSNLFQRAYLDLAAKLPLANR